jgi:UDP-glucose 6-dehydrogenase
MSVAVVGCGKLGVTMAVAFAAKGVSVYGVDLVGPVVDGINNRTLCTKEPGVQDGLRAIPAGAAAAAEGGDGAPPSLRATSDLREALRAVETVVIAVDTPSTGGDRHYDHSKVAAVLSGINRFVREQLEVSAAVGLRHVVVACTVMPGWLFNVGSHLLRDSGELVGGLLYNPLFIAQGEIMKGLLNPDLILIGEPAGSAGSSAAGDALVSLWQRVLGRAEPAELPVRRMSWTSAEITKLSLNCFVTMKIAFANMIGDVCDAAAAREAAASGLAGEPHSVQPGEDIDVVLSPTPTQRQACDKHAVLAAIGQDRRIGALCLRPGYVSAAWVTVYERDVASAYKALDRVWVWGGVRRGAWRGGAGWLMVGLIGSSLTTISCVPSVARAPQGFGGPCFPRDNRAFATVADGLGVAPLLPRATDVSGAFPSFMRPVLTEMYLCHACSCPEIEDGNAPAGRQRGTRPGAGGADRAGGGGALHLPGRGEG